MAQLRSLLRWYFIVCCLHPTWWRQHGPTFWDCEQSYLWSLPGYLSVLYCCRQHQNVAISRNVAHLILLLRGFQENKHVFSRPSAKTWSEVSAIWWIAPINTSGFGLGKKYSMFPSLLIIHFFKEKMAAYFYLFLLILTEGYFPIDF